MILISITNYENLNLNFWLNAHEHYTMPGIDSTHPEVAAQWHPTRNGKLKPADVTAGSNKKVWWLCPKTCPEGCAHEWEARIASRCMGNNCPYCSQKKVSCEHVSIVFTHPDIAAQLHPALNGELKPSDVTTGCNKKVWWLCNKKCPEGCVHEWEASIVNRCSKNVGCPICAHQKIGCEHNSIVYTHPTISAEWHPTRNGNLKPLQFTKGTHIKVWWLCKQKCSQGCLHEWETSIHNRCRYGCPYCTQRLVSCIHASIVITHPDVASQWHPTKNGSLKPSDVTSGCGKKVWWLCPNKCPEGCLHEWEAAVYSKCARNICAFCSNRAISCTHASLIGTHPKIASEWHPIKNIALKPSGFTSGSGEKIWWKCHKGHEWNAAIYSRCGNNSGCPSCKHKTEDKLNKYLLSRFTDVESQYRADWCKSLSTKQMYRYDFYIPSLKLIIELDGPQHFKQISNWSGCEDTQKRDVYKMQRAFEQGLSVIRLLQEEVLNETEEWLDTHLKPHLEVADECCYIFISGEKNEGIYSAHEQLLESGEEVVFEDVESCEEEDECIGSTIADFL
jgi:hypothetical protein